VILRPNEVVEKPSDNLAPVISILQYLSIDIFRKEVCDAPLQTHRHRHEAAAD
jgi:hypothetical protein